MKQGLLLPALLLSLALINHTAVAGLSVGTIVLYSDGSALKLLSIRDKTSRWQDQRLRTLTLSDNPLLPPLKREGMDGVVQRVEQLAKGKPAGLRNAPRGTAVEFSTNRLDRRGNTSTRNYSCTTLGTAVKRVLGREEKVQRFHCERFSIHKKLWTRKVKESRTFSYSPRLKLVTEQVRTTKKGERRRHLLGIFRPGRYSYLRVKTLLEEAKQRGGKQ